MAEHLTRNEKVVGSIPTISSKNGHLRKANVHFWIPWVYFNDRGRQSRPCAIHFARQNEFTAHSRRRPEGRAGTGLFPCSGFENVQIVVTARKNNHTIKCGYFYGYHQRFRCQGTKLLRCKMLVWRKHAALLCGEFVARFLELTAAAAFSSETSYLNKIAAACRSTALVLSIKTGS